MISKMKLCTQNTQAVISGCYEIRTGLLYVCIERSRMEILLKVGRVQKISAF